MRKQLAAAAAIAAVAGVIATTAAPAHAETATRHDRVGDTTAPNDVTWMRVTNGPRQLRIVVHYRDLGPRHISAAVIIDTRRPGGERYVFSRHRVDEGTVVTPLLRQAPGVYHEVRCPARTVSYRPGEPSRIVFTLPQRCLGSDAGDARFSYEGSHHEGPPPPRPEYVAERHPFLVRQDG